MTQKDKDRNRRTVLLFGVEKDLASELHAALQQTETPVVTDSCHEVTELNEQSPDIVFSGFSHDLASLVESVNAPVVVIDRHAEYHKYLSAMEAGAHDYCAGRLEPSDLNRILKNAASNSAE